MDLSGFEKFLSEKKVNEKGIKEALEIIEVFENFISEKEKESDIYTYKNFRLFSNKMIEEGLNSFDNYIHIYRYGWFTKNNDLIIGSMEAIDGAEVIENFSKKLVEQFGEELRNEIFSGTEIPPLGLDPKGKPRITKNLINKFLAKIDHKSCKELLAEGLRPKYTESYKASRKLYLESKNFDDFLRAKKQKFLNTLEEHFKEETLFFTQEIDESVINYVKENHGIESGIRKGNQLFISKIPYMTKQFLKETDEQKKKFYYCHCPWAREALRTKNLTDQLVDPIFCNCSGGYYKNYWEAVLDEPVKVEVVKSILKGDSECQFCLHIPSGILKK